MQSTVDLLKSASNAYYNGEEPIMDDDTYDALVDQLREKDPHNPFLKTVGSPPQEGVVKLPALMPSLDKIKPGESTLTRFLALARSYVLSEKLDGLSGLWCPATKGLFLRGDGVNGQTISHIAGSISSLVPSAQPWIIRGELVLPKTASGLGTTPARTVINGLVHKSSPDLRLLSQVEFLAYEVIYPAGMKRSEQFTWLQAEGFKVPWWMGVDRPTEENLKELFTVRRSSSPYDTDGIVVGLDRIPFRSELSIAPKPPKDCVAFKMPVSDQSAITTVEEVLWSPSAQGYLIPRIRIQPVKIGGAKIEFCTGHNARTIVDKGIGPGAQIKVRRSGDVIPTLDSVLIPAKGSLPTGYTWEWTEASATHIKLVGESADQQTSQLHLFAKTIDISGLGPANCKALVEAGVTGPSALWSQTPEQLATVLGPKTGPTLHINLRNKLLSPALTELTLLVASNKMPRSTGETKLATLLLAEPDMSKWTSMSQVPPGWTEDSFQAFQTAFPAYETWRRDELKFIPYPLKVSTPVSQKSVCFTGFRDKALEESAKAHFQIVATVSSKLTVLVIPDGSANHESEKVKKARAIGTEILQASEFTKKYLI